MPAYVHRFTRWLAIAILFMAGAVQAQNLTAVQSRKTHGAAGVFNFPIDIGAPIGGSVSIEPRAMGAGHGIVFIFDAPVNTATASAVDAFGNPVGTVTQPTLPATQVVVGLAGVADNSRVTVTLSNINGAGNVSASMAFLLGDVNGSGGVDATDLSAVKARSGTGVNANNFQYDVSVTGTIGAADIASVKSHLGRALPGVAQVSLSVAVSGTGNGSVASSSGINCPSGCAINVPANTSVTLTALPGTGTSFVGWSGACSGMNASTTIVVSANANCIANFAWTTFTVTTSVNGGGSISPVGPVTVSYGASATFTLTPSAGSTMSVGGTCDGVLSGNVYTTAPVTASCSVTATFTPGSAPVILYTDIVSGPNTGGENNKGIYLSIFGRNFGTAGLGTSTKVFINDVEVDNYRYLGTSRGRTDIQQISVQIGAIGNPTAGVALPIRVSVSGADSNTDKTFTVNPGNIYFVNNLTGVDTSGTTTGGTFTAPFKSVQRKAGASISFSIDSAANAGAWGRVRAGDFIVIRGTGTAYTTNATTGANNGFNDYFVQTLNKSGCAVGTKCAQGGGTTSGPITFMGYPNEDVFINNPYNAATDSGAFSGADSTRIQSGFGHWINVVNLRIESGNHDGAVNTQAGGTNWRIVNNELTCATAVNNDTAKGGGIAGDGHVTVAALGPSVGSFYLGNYIHDVYNGPDDGNSNFENHGFYIDGAGTYDIGYNRIENIRGGNGISMYANGTLGNDNVDGVSFHHNIIKGVGKHGINVADGTRNNIRIWNNVVYNTDRAGIRFNTTDLNGAKIYNNTFYNTNRINNAATGAIMTDANFSSATAVDIRNNIFVPVTGDYDVLNFNFKGTVTNNLWFNGTGTNPASSYSTASVQTNPLFVATASGNFKLQTGSPAINAGTGIAAVTAVVKDDFEQAARPLNGGWDIGAYER